MAEEDKNQLVEMGYVKAAFGVHGWIKLAVQTEYPDSLLAFDTWYLAKGGQWRTFTVEEGKLVDDGILAKLAGVDGRDQAHALRGHTVAVPRDTFAPTEEDEYYWADLVGMSVTNQEQIALGEVVDLMQTGAHDVLVIKGEYGQKLIPFVSQFILDVNEQTRSIKVDWGMDY